jgi:MFS superfamily sulfate permease-like transporter
VQNHVFALDTVARSGLDGEDRTERERSSFALARADDDGSLEALGDADYHLVLEYKIGGPLTYVTASTHCKRFADISVDHVLLNLSHVTRIDLDGIAALEVAAGSACARRWSWGNGVAAGG